MKKITLPIALFLIMITCIYPLASQSQIGQDILGEGAIDHCGQSVSFSSDGNRVVIGSPFHIGPSYGSGHARVFDLIGGAWTQVGANIDGEAELDHSGQSVDISSDGSRIVIGAPDNDGNGNKAGHSRIFQLEAGDWIQLGQSIEGAQEEDESGTRVSMSADGNRVAINAPFHDEVGLEDAGHIQVFELQDNTWVQIGQDINGLVGDNLLGHSIDLSPDGNRLAVGTPYEPNSIGYVRIFELIGDTWTPLGSTIVGDPYNSLFGTSVSFSENDRLAISTGFSNGLSEGTIEVYELNGSNWIQVGAPFIDEGVSNVSLSANGNIVAATVGDIFGSTGIVKIFQYDNTSWTQVGIDIVGGGDDGGFGSAISLSANGGRLAIGVPSFSDIPYYTQGKVKLYSLPLCASTTGTDVITSCEPYAWIDGNTYTSSNNTATYNLINAEGCDSIVTLDLNIPVIDVSITNSSPTLMANESGATYQWLDCDNGNAEIAGATSQTYVASSNGNYAVRISIDGCTSTSDCINVNTVDIDEYNFVTTATLSPNPTTGIFELQAANFSRTKIVDQFGRTVLERKNTDTTFNISDFSDGIYFIQIHYKNMVITKKFVKI